MTSKELEVKLRVEINDDIRIKEHPTIAGLSQVYWKSEFVTTCPTYDVREVADRGYGIEFPNGSFQMHRSQSDIKAIAQAHIDFMQSEEGDQLLKDEAAIREAELKERNNPQPLNESNLTV